MGGTCSARESGPSTGSTKSQSQAAPNRHANAQVEHAPLATIVLVCDAPGADFDAAVKYFQDKFAAINERVRPGEHIDPYVTCATDSEKFHVIIGNCEKAILMKNLEEAGVGL